MEKLFRLRLFFIIYFVIKVILDITYGKIFVTDTFEKIIPAGSSRFFQSSVMLNAFIIFIYVLLFGLGILIFHFLLRKSNGARILLLIIGMVMVIDAVTSVLFQRQILTLLSRITREIEWSPLLSLDRLTDLLGLIFGGFLIYTLQFKAEVKALFFNSEAENQN